MITTTKSIKEFIKKRKKLRKQTDDILGEILDILLSISKKHKIDFGHYGITAGYLHSDNKTKDFYFHFGDESKMISIKDMDDEEYWYHVRLIICCLSRFPFMLMCCPPLSHYKQK